MNTKRHMIDSGAAPKTPSIRRQCALIALNRASWYNPWPTQDESPENVTLMDRIDEIYTAHPFYGSRKITAVLGRDGYPINRKRVQRLMRVMGIQSIE